MPEEVPFCPWDSVEQDFRFLQSVVSAGSRGGGFHEYPGRVTASGSASEPKLKVYALTSPKNGLSRERERSDSSCWTALHKQRTCSGTGNLSGSDGRDDGRRSTHHFGQTRLTRRKGAGCRCLQRKDAQMVVCRNSYKNTDP